VTTEEPVLEVHQQFEVALDELRVAFSSTMRELFGGPGELAGRHGDTEQVAQPDDAVSSVTGSSSTTAPESTSLGDVEPVAAEPSVTDSADIEQPVDEPVAVEPELVETEATPEPETPAPGGPIAPDAPVASAPVDVTAAGIGAEATAKDADGHSKA
jgi:hypothetical protein